MTETEDVSFPLSDRYEVGRELGRGGMADVRLGKDLRLGRDVAIKLLRSDLASDPTFQERFRREAQSAASLNHPSIVAVYDTGQFVDANGVTIPYIVMEYVQGRTVRDILRDGRKILPERALSITADILSALDYSHRAGIIHRDIKPANVMLTPDGTVKVMDFGIARAIADTSTAMTQTAAVIGTAQYLSPEQARGETVDARSDIYSTGCVLYELLTGRPPFVGDSPVSVAYQHVREEARPPSQLNPDVSLDIDHIVAKALAKRVDDRYSSAADMRKDLERAIGGFRVDAPTQATAVVSAPTQTVAALAQEPEEEPKKSRKALWWSLAILALAVAAAIGFALMMDNQPKTKTTMVSVPSIAGKSQNDAETALRNAGLKVGEVTQENSDTVDSGKVVRSDPSGGDRVAKGSKVALVVSSGVEQVEVPSLAGLSWDAAAATLKQRGLTAKKQYTQATTARDQFVNSQPVTGTMVNPGSTVTVLVSTGQATLANYTGMSVNDARTAINNLRIGLKIRTVQDTTSTEPAGTVISQDPTAAASVYGNTTITLTVSAGASATTAPPSATTPTPSPTTAPTESPQPESQDDQ